MSDRVFDPVSFVKARRAQQAADLANGDVTSIINMIAGLQQQVADLTDALALTAGEVTTLTTHLSTTDGNVTALTTQLSTTNGNVTALTTTYGLHTHGYGDVDNLGVTLNKTTSIPA